MARRGLWATFPPAAALALGLAAAIGAGGTAAAVTPTEWTRLPTSQRVVALTFDCGGNDAGVSKIVAALKRRHAAATFFLTGHWTDAYPSQARAVASAYAIGNHTYSHPHLTWLTDSAVRDEIRSAERKIYAVTSRHGKPLFRFPYGDRDSRTLALAAGLGYRSIGWTVDTLGWEGRSASGGTSAIVARVLARLQPGEIVLMHVGAALDGSTLDADALPALLDAIAARGYGFTTLTDYAGGTAQVVDDATTGRFKASSAWLRGTTNPKRYGRSYRYARPRDVADPARFRLRVPTRGDYLVYGRWPSASGYNSATPFGIDTVDGLRFVSVDQRRDGGRWVYLGSYRLTAGDRFAVRVSRRSKAGGYVVADAVRAVRRP